MTDYSDDYDDNEAWDGQTDNVYDDSEYGYDDDFDCGMVNDKRLCADAGTEHCSFFCPLHTYVMSRNPDEMPLPEGYRYDDIGDVIWIDPDEINDDLPF